MWGIVGMKQNKAYIIGITGGIGTGKSLVSTYLLSKGYKVIDLDLIARTVVEKNQPGYFRIVEFFGRDILDSKENINRKKLGEIVFSNGEYLKKLNSITHPLINEEMRRQIQMFEEMGEAVIFCDVPLLFEGNMKSYFDEVWLVYAKRDLQLERVMNRDNASQEQAEARLNNQMDIEEKKFLADKIIYNTGTAEETYKQLNNLIKSIL